MAVAGFAHHLVDLRHAPAATLAEATAMYGQHALIDLDLADAFDAVIHVQELTPARGAEDIPTDLSTS